LARNVCDDNPLIEADGERGCCVGFVYSIGRDSDNSHTSDTGNISISWLPDDGNTISLSKTGVLRSRPCIKPCNLLQQTDMNTEKKFHFLSVLFNVATNCQDYIV
jgi:hypothetical protein